MLHLLPDKGKYECVYCVASKAEGHAICCCLALLLFCLALSVSLSSYSVALQPLLSIPLPPSASKYSSPLGFFVAIIYAVCFVLSDVRSFVASLLFFVAPKLTTISFHLLSEVNSSVPRSFISPLPSSPPLPCRAHTHCHLIFCHFVQLLLAGLIILTASTGWMEGR